MSHRRIAGLLVSALISLPMLVSAAGIFPDVTDSHPFKGEIESLARGGIVKGNPDGNFYPDKSVNRAEFLKLLYTAMNRQPKSIYVGCFADVERGSWYEAFVCDAASKENGFVQGYSDGKFRPASPVSRTEALKMIFTVFGLPVGDISAQDQDIIKFVDISVSAWYSKYISAAYKVGVLPINGQAGARFYPDKELSRGEAAAYIFNAMNGRAHAQESSSSSSSSSVSSSVMSSSSSSAPTEVLKSVSFPFADSDSFSGRKSVSYLFTLTAARTMFSLNTTIYGYYPSDVSCRLYLIGEDGFSSEYYLGVQSTNSCDMNVAVGPGKYQLQIQPSVASVPYKLSAKGGTSDGNDGFIDALTMLFNRPYVATLEANDYYDWYKFSVTKEQIATVMLSSPEDMNCIIYTPASVDQYGFSGPQCGSPYTFVPGDSYIVGIGRKGTGSNVAAKLTYTIKWQ